MHPAVSSSSSSFSSCRSESLCPCCCPALFSSLSLSSSLSVYSQITSQLQRPHSPLARKVSSPLVPPPPPPPTVFDVFLQGRLSCRLVHVDKNILSLLIDLIRFFIFFFNAVTNLKSQQCQAGLEKKTNGVEFDY